MFDDLDANLYENADIIGDGELHEGTGTGLELTVEEAWKEALAIVEAPEPYYELHQGAGTGKDLDPAEAILQAEAILFEAWKGEQS